MILRLSIAQAPALRCSHCSAPCTASISRRQARPTLWVVSRPAGAGKAHAAARRAQLRQQRSVLVRGIGAFDDSYGHGAEEEEEEAPDRYQYPNPEFIKETLEAFPDQGVASVEEARALWQEGGYTYLDVRPKLEWDDIGHVRPAPGGKVVNVPIKHSKRVFDAKTRKKVAQKTENPEFVAQVEKKFPDKEAKILIGCSDGRAYSMDALMALDEAGYTNIAGLKGGYYAWISIFSNKLERRRYGEYAENYTGEGSDSCGIHASGAGFERSDFVERQFVPPEGY